MPPLTKPLIGAVNGVAITGGFEVALACDFLVASEKAAFADTHARVGIMPGWGLTVLLPEAVGFRRAKELSATGNFLDAPTALAWGLVNHVVAHDECVPFAQELAADIATNDQRGPPHLPDLRRGCARRRRGGLGHRGTGRRRVAGGRPRRRRARGAPQGRHRTGPHPDLMSTSPTPIPAAAIAAPNPTSRAVFRHLGKAVGATNRESDSLRLDLLSRLGQIDDARHHALVAALQEIDALDPAGDLGAEARLAVWFTQAAEAEAGALLAEAWAETTSASRAAMTEVARLVRASAASD